MDERAFASWVVIMLAGRLPESILAAERSKFARSCPGALVAEDIENDIAKPPYPPESCSPSDLAGPILLYPSPQDRAGRSFE